MLEEIDRIVIHQISTDAEYSFNHRPALDNFYPDGLGAEVINFEALVAIDQHAVMPAHREHVTAYIWDHLGDFRAKTAVAPRAVAGLSIKLDIDTNADLARLEVLCSEARSDIEAWGAVDIVRTYRWRIGEAKDELVDINARSGK